MKKSSRNQQKELTRYNCSAASPHYAKPLLMTTEKVNYSNKGKTWAVFRIAAQPKLGTRYKEYVRDCLNFFTKTRFTYILRLKLIVYRNRFFNFCKFCSHTALSHSVSWFYKNLIFANSVHIVHFLSLWADLAKLIDFAIFFHRVRFHPMWADISN